MKKKDLFRRKGGMILIDNYWIDEAEAEKYLSDRKEAIRRVKDAMSTFCYNVGLEWADSEDG